MQSTAVGDCTPSGIRYRLAMADRPACIVSASDAPGFDYHPEAAPTPIACLIRPLSDRAGLSRMGVRVREIEPGHAGTHLHFHDTEEEWAFVLSGHGRFRLGPESIPVQAGHFVGIPPAPCPHHFIASGESPLVVLEGGERRRGEDWCTYPLLGLRSRDGSDEAIDVDALPPCALRGDAVIQVAGLAEKAWSHPLDDSVVRHGHWLARAAGLERQACTWVRLEPGVASTVFHFHEHTEEWVYVLSGELEVRIGDDGFAVGAGDFVAHPAGGPAHMMRAHTEAVYLMGGQSRSDDIVRYPDRQMILGPGGFERVAGGG